MSMDGNKTKNGTVYIIVLILSLNIVESVLGLSKLFESVSTDNPISSKIVSNLKENENFGERAEDFNTFTLSETQLGENFFPNNNEREIDNEISSQFQRKHLQEILKGLTKQTTHKTHTSCCATNHGKVKPTDSYTYEVGDGQKEGDKLKLFGIESDIKIPILTDYAKPKFKLHLHSHPPNHSNIGSSLISASIPNITQIFKNGNRFRQKNLQSQHIFSTPAPKNFHPSSYEGVNSQSFPGPLHGSHGEYSWTIEKGSPELLEMVGILPPHTIYKAIAEAEKIEKLRKESQAKAQGGAHKGNGGHGGGVNSIEEIRHAVNYEADKYPGFKPSPYYPFSHEQSNPIKLSSTNYIESFPQSEYYKYKTFPQKGHLDHSHHSYSPGYDQGFSGWTNPTKWGSIDNWLSKFKSMFSGGSKGSYNSGKLSQKILELSIGGLALLAFGGYIAALIFQALLPSLSFPLFPIFNITNPGLFNLLFGRSLKDPPARVVVIEDHSLNYLDRLVKHSLRKGNLKYKQKKLE